MYLYIGASQNKCTYIFVFNYSHLVNNNNNINTNCFYGKHIYYSGYVCNSQTVVCFGKTQLLSVFPPNIHKTRLIFWLKMTKTNANSLSTNLRRTLAFAFIPKCIPEPNNASSEMRVFFWWFFSHAQPSMIAPHLWNRDDNDGHFQHN